MLAKSVIIAAFAAFGSVEATFGLGLGFKHNWGCNTLQKDKTPVPEKQLCKDPGAFLFGFGNRALCSSPKTRDPKPPSDILCPLLGWSFYKGGIKCCIPNREQTECDCGEGYSFNKQQAKCLPNGPTKCGRQEWWQERSSSCCPHDWKPHQGTCPPGIRCPTGWYWHKGHKVCRPHGPRSPEPDCDDWNPGKHCCGHGPTQPSSKPTPPGPVKPPGKPDDNPGKPDDKPGKPDDKPGQPGKPHKRSIDLRSKHQIQFAQNDIDKLYCPGSLHACSVNAGPESEWSYECIDPATELESCGGCASTGEGQDCTQIANAVSVGCEAGTCAVYTCKSGFSNNGTACV